VIVAVSCIPASAIKRSARSSELNVDCNIQGTFREHSGNIQGTFRSHIPASAIKRSARSSELNANCNIQ
jgi:hypothetical protein